MQPSSMSWYAAGREWVRPLPVTILLLTLLFAWFIIWGDQGLLTWRQLAATRAELAANEVQLAARLQLLSAELQRLEDPRLLEPIIRRELGFVRPNETVFQFPEK